MPIMAITPLMLLLLFPGDAMVPLADIFNHKASLVLLDDAWKVAEEMDAQQQQQGDEHCRDEHRGATLR